MQHRAQFTTATTGIDVGVTVFRISADGQLIPLRSVDLDENAVDPRDATWALNGIGWDTLTDWEADDRGGYWADVEKL